MKPSIKVIQTSGVIPHMSDEQVLPNLADVEADFNTISLLCEVEALRAKLRVLEPQLSVAITAYGLRRGLRGYREFYLRNELNTKAYTEANNVR